MEEATKDINRIKVVLVEKKRTNKWLAEQLGKDPATVSKWCTNTSQPGLETLLQIANVLDVDVKDLLHSTKEDTMYFKVPTNFTDAGNAALHFQSNIYGSVEQQGQYVKRITQYLPQCPYNVQRHIVCRFPELAQKT